MPPKKRITSDSDLDTSAMFQQILNELKLINSRIDNIEQKVTNIETSLDYHAQEVEELKADVNEIKSSFPTTVRKVEELEQLNLQKSVEVQGIPFNSGEDLHKIVMKLAEIKSISVELNNIDVCYRNRNKNKLIIRFLQQHKRDLFLAGYKKPGDDLTAKDLGYRDCKSKIFVNELLSYEIRNLFYKVRKFKEENNYKFAWTINQKIYIRKDQGTEAKRIKSEHDLELIR